MLLKRPVVYLGGSVPNVKKAALQKIIKGHGGTVVDAVELASHVVDWDEEIDSLPTEMAEEYVRTLEVRSQEVGGTALVHWYYFPDSYDEWIPSEHVDSTEPPDTVPQATDRGIGRPWRVCVRYVLDCDMFNEWGNEVDYESTPEVDGEDDDDEGKSPPKSGSSRKQRGRKKYDPTKVKVAPVLEAVVATEKMMSDARPPLLGGNDVAVVEMTSGTDCQLTQVKAESSSSSSYNADDSDAVGSKRKAPDELNPATANAASSGKLPDWYHPDTVCDLEIKYLPEFFTAKSATDSTVAQSRSVAEYIRIRNFIVNLYAQNAQNPSMYLSATDCRKKVAGDVGVILKIHDFLDAFGAINYSVNSDGRPALLPASFSHWRTDTDATSLANAGMLPSSLSFTAPAASSTLLTESGLVRWSGKMDNSLKHGVVIHSGDWIAVAAGLAEEFKDYKPTPQECLARFVSLPLTTPSVLVESDIANGKSDATESAESCAAAAIVTGKPAQRLRLLSSLIADRAAASLGSDAAREVVSNAVATLRKRALSKNAEVAAPIATAAAAISSSAREGAETEEARLKDLVGDYLSNRLSALEEKMKLLAEVDRTIDVERERLEVDRRDVQIQRAQAASALR